MAGYEFTHEVRHALMRSRDHAASRHHGYVGTEHILLSLLDEQEGPAATVLDKLQVDRDMMRSTIDTIVKPGAEPARVDLELPYTSRAKKVLEHAMHAARNEGVDFVGTEHVLLGLIHEGVGIGAQVLDQAEVTDSVVTRAIQEMR